MSTLPKISVVTVTYNAERSLEATILSVINQTYPNIEYIIIDGKSKDGTVDIIKKYTEHINYWVSEPDKGIYDAMNKGIGKATGEWINFMNAGDSFVNERVLTDVFNIHYKQETGCIFGDSIIYKKNKICKQSINPFWLQTRKIKSKGICHQACFIKTKLAKQFQYDITYKIAADFKLLLDIRNNNHLFYYFPIPICLFDTTGISSNPYLCFKDDIRLAGLPLNLYTKIIYIHRSLRKPIRQLIQEICLKLFYLGIKWPYNKIKKNHLILNTQINKGYV